MKKKQGKTEFIIPKIGEKYKNCFYGEEECKTSADELILTKLKREFPPSLKCWRGIFIWKVFRKEWVFWHITYSGTDYCCLNGGFTDGKPKKSDYRKFRINSLPDETGKPDDFSFQWEKVIFRRFRKLLSPDLKLNGDIIGTENPDGDDPSFHQSPTWL